MRAHHGTRTLPDVAKRKGRLRYKYSRESARDLPPHMRDLFLANRDGAKEKTNSVKKYKQVRSGYTCKSMPLNSTQWDGTPCCAVC